MRMWDWCQAFRLHDFGPLLAMKGGDAGPEIDELKSVFPGLNVEVINYDNRLVDCSKNRFLVKVEKKKEIR